MNKHLIVLGIAVLLICVGLSGCTNNSDTEDVNEEPSEYNLGESFIVGNIKYTFLSDYWEESWDTYWYYLEVKAENIGLEVESSRIWITDYEMENGYKYNPTTGHGWVDFFINPGKNDTQTIRCSEDTQTIRGIDRDYLPVAKIHMGIHEITSASKGTPIIIYVMI